MNQTEATAVQALAPQLVRYGIAIVASLLTGMGIASANDIQIVTDNAVPIATGIAAVAPVLYRIATTLLARRRVG